jgi:hypothetical protein
VPSDYLTFLDKYYQEQGLENRSQGLVKILESYRLAGLQTSEEFRPERCKGCLQYGGINNEGILCIVKKSETDPVRSHFTPLAVAKACSEKPFNTPPNRKSRQQYENEISLLTTENKSAIAQRKRDHEKLEKMKGLGEKLERAESEIEFLNAQLKPVENLLEQKTALENDNVFQTGRIEELEAIVETQSHDPLIQKNQELITRIDECEADLKSAYTSHKMESEQAKGEIEKLEALVKTQKDQKTDILFTMEKTLKDFKQFLPGASSQCEQCLNAFNWKEYRQNTLKLIQNLEGYLQTKAR